MDPLCRKIKDTLDRPVVLIGLMGAGKTRLGGMLAKSVGLSFADSDREIERAAGMTVPEIFERFGEPHFREMEEKILARLLSDGVRVIATGGGAVMNGRTAQRIWDSAVSIWLDADTDVLVERAGRNNNRPLLAGGDRTRILTELKAVRGAVYERADITVDTSGADTSKTFQALLDALAGHLEQRNTP